MIEVFLYKCEKCDSVMAVYGDRGRKFYMNKCEVCKDWADFEKIVIFSKYKLTDVGFGIEEYGDEG